MTKLDERVTTRQSLSQSQLPRFVGFLEQDHVGIVGRNHIHGCGVTLQAEIDVVRHHPQVRGGGIGLPRGTGISTPRHSKKHEPKQHWPGFRSTAHPDSVAEATTRCNWLWLAVAG